jgi:hypothetical protein
MNLTDAMARIERVNPDVITAIAGLQAALSGWCDGFAAPQKKRGALVGLLDNALGHLVNDMAAMGYDVQINDASAARHLFLGLIWPWSEGSSAGLTEGQVDYLLSQMSYYDPETRTYPANTATLDMYRAITKAAIDAKIILPLTDESDDEPSTPKEETMATSLPVIDNINDVVQPAASPAPVATPAPSHTGQKPEPVAVQEHGEAVLSATAKFQDENGADWLFTMRAGVTGKMAVDFAKNLSAFSAWMVEHGYTPEGNGYSRSHSAVAPSAQSLPSTSSAPLPVQSDAQPLHPANSLSFAAETLTGSVNKGKIYWKIRGGPFSKFGVTVWPEVLQSAGIEPSTLDPMQEYKLNGYNAMYQTVIKDGKENPEKVVALQRVA